MRLLPEHTSSEETFETINSWLKDCFANHANCQPTESLTAGLLGGIRFLHIRNNTVFLTDSIRPARYIALSHCWGSGAHITKTTSSNITLHMKTGIAVDLLPQTFRDAIQICKKLAIEYLWIDSLCIIQDNPQDWRIQASRMEDVYKNAHLTIAASKAHDPTQGCFTKTHWSFRGETLPGHPSILIRRICVPPGRYFDHFHGSNDADGSASSSDDWPLYKRGWIYQELVLSPRVVHFGAQEVMWHCTTLAKRGQSQTNKFANLPSSFLKHKRFTADRFRDQWYQTITAYSCRELTFQKDRLPAIAAIARQMAVLRPGDAYLAGLWRDTLVFDVLWYVHGSSSESKEKGSSDAVIPRSKVPSWSWASVSQGVAWPSCTSYLQLQCVTVLDTVYVTDGPVVSGKIKEAYIKLRAPLIRVDTLPTRQSFSSAHDPSLALAAAAAAMEPDHPQQNTMFELIIDLWFLDTPPALNSNAHSASYGHPAPAFHNTENLPHASRLFALPVSTQVHDGDLERFGHMVLLVERTEEEATYRRVGVVMIQCGGASALTHTNTFFKQGGKLEDLLRAREVYRERLVEAIKGMETHVITLV